MASCYMSSVWSIYAYSNIQSIKEVTALVCIIVQKASTL